MSGITATGTTELFHIQTLSNFINWQEQVEYILNIEMDGGSQQLIKRLGAQYELIHNCQFANDRLRYLHLYLKHTHIIQAICLYENMNEKARREMVSAIRQEYLHLADVIIIHNELTRENVRSC